MQGILVRAATWNLEWAERDNHERAQQAEVIASVGVDVWVLFFRGPAQGPTARMKERH